MPIVSKSQIISGNLLSASEITRADWLVGWLIFPLLDQLSRLRRKIECSVNDQKITLAKLSCWLDMLFGHWQWQQTWKCNQFSSPLEIVRSAYRGEFETGERRHTHMASFYHFSVRVCVHFHERLKVFQSMSMIFVWNESLNAMLKSEVGFQKLTGNFKNLELCR